MTSPNNMDLGGVVGRLFGAVPGEAKMLAELETNDPPAHAIAGAAVTAYDELGPDFSAKVYREAFAIELRAAAIPFDRDVAVQVRYKDHHLDTDYVIDFLCNGDTAVFVRTFNALTKDHDKELIGHLKASGHPRGMMMNFGPRFEFRRIVKTGTPGAR